jgi:hypothetical protein
MDRMFTLFPKLLIELRLNIWRSALPLFPRILEAKPNKPWSNTTERSRSPKWSITPTNTTPLLSINQESRNELNKYYVMPFSPYNIFPAQGSPLDFRLVTRGRPYLEPYPEINALRFNYKVDTLFLDITDLCHLWPRIYTFSEIVGSVFGDAYPKAQQKLRRLAGTEDFFYLFCNDDK